MMRTTPHLLITLHLSHMGFTLVRTFIKIPLGNVFVEHQILANRNGYNPVSIH